MLEAEIVQGRKISGVEISEITSLIEANPLWSRYRLSRVLAQRWQWYSAAGQLKDMAARSLLQKLHQRDLIALPERRRGPGRTVSASWVLTARAIKWSGASPSRSPDGDRRQLIHLRRGRAT